VAAAGAFQRVMAPLPLIGGLLGSILLVTGFLRTLALASRIDELTARQWHRLARMRSGSGIAFFPTRDARVELEAAIADAVHVAQGPDRRRPARRARSTSAVA
jgi:hypothetical protein